MKKYLVVSIIAIFILNSCSKDDESAPVMDNETISGYVQKGPFINGTSISINELNSDLSQTGKTYSTQIADNKGSFEIGNVELASNFVGLKADGFYFNETMGEQSTSQITLYALSDVSDKSTVNINVLTDLEKPRVEYLIAQGAAFSEAKAQAQTEILEIFNISESLTEPSEDLDISQDGDDNAILLATSLILQGYRTEGEFSELLSNISTDIREDGVLNNNSTSSKLINHAVYLDTTSIRNNLNARYSELGIDAEIPNFEKYIRNFIDSTSFEITESLIEYPATGSYGENILDLNKESYSGENFSLASNLARGTELKVKITALGTGIWFSAVGSSNNWSISEFDEVSKSQSFTAIDSNRSCDLNMQFDSGTYLIEYFEMGATEPNRTKIIAI